MAMILTEKYNSISISLSHTNIRWLFHISRNNQKNAWSNLGNLINLNKMFWSFVFQYTAMRYSLEILIKYRLLMSAQISQKHQLSIRKLPSESIVIPWPPNSKQLNSPASRRTSLYPIFHNYPPVTDLSRVISVDDYATPSYSSLLSLLLSSTAPLSSWSDIPDNQQQQQW